MTYKLLAAVLMLLPLLSQAEIYKWKDKNGVTRYSDVRPSNVPYESMSKKVPAPPPTVPNEAAPAPAPAPAAAPAGQPPAANTDNAAAKRQQEAEENKRKAETREAELQAKQQRCSAAQARMQQYKIGGRISKINEKGEREYLGDAEIAKGLEDAQKEVAEACQ